MLQSKIITDIFAFAKASIDDGCFFTNDLVIPFSVIFKKVKNELIKFILQIYFAETK